MSTALYSHTTRATGTVLTALIYNSDHQNHITNGNPSQHGGYSDTVAQMQTQTDPGEVGTESLSASQADEWERIRFAIAELKGTTNWYQTAASSINQLASSGSELNAQVFGG